jgi:hypothetical protein
MKIFPVIREKVIEIFSGDAGRRYAVVAGGECLAVADNDGALAGRRVSVILCK